MERFIWVGGIHSIGHGSIDSQHKRLAGVVNELIDLAENGYAEIQLSDVVTKMMWYAEDHFDAEEAYMCSIHAPILDAQKDVDREYKERVKWMMHNSTWRDIESVVQFLRDWLTTRIMIAAFQFKYSLAVAA